MTPQQIERWKEHFTIEVRLEHIRERARELLAAKKRRAKALEASTGSRFVVSSTGRGKSSARNGGHNTLQKRLSDANQSYRDILADLKAMVNATSEYE